jgi:hypothetical protein
VHIAWYIFCLAVIWYVFDHLEGRPETVIVPILGLVYAASESRALIQATYNLTLGKGLDDVLSLLRSIAYPGWPPEKENAAEAKKITDAAQRSVYVQSVFLAILSPFCAYKLFTAL